MGLLDAFQSIAEDLSRDVRQKLVEEGWFGRALTARPEALSVEQETPQSLSVELGWTEWRNAEPSSDHSAVSHDADRAHGVDR